jgi:hypothetical protein
MNAPMNPIPTPRTDANLKENDSWLVDPELSRTLETELHLANTKLTLIRELVEKAQALNLDLLPLNSFTKILNS